MRQVLCAESIGTAGLATVVVGSGIMGERLAGEHSTVLPPGTHKVRWPLTDPAKDTDEAIIVVFRATRDEVNELVTGFIARTPEERAA